MNHRERFEKWYVEKEGKRWLDCRTPYDEEKYITDYSLWLESQLTEAQQEIETLKKRLSEGVGYVIVRDCNGDLFIHQHSSSNEGIKINRYWFKNLDNDAEMPIAIVPLTDSELKEGE